MRDKNKILVQKAALIWASKDFEKLSELYASDCIQHQQKQHKNVTIIGLEAWRRNMEEFLKAYPDYVEHIVEQIAEDDKVVSVLDCRASKVCWSGITIDRIEQGKIQETWAWFKRKEK